MVNLKSSLRKLYNRHHGLFNRYELSLSHTTTYVPLIVSTSLSFPHSRLITGFVTRGTRWMPLVETKRLTIPEHLCSPLVFSGFRVALSFFSVYYFVDHCLSFCHFYFRYYVVCHSTYGFGIFKLFYVY